MKRRRNWMKNYSCDLKIFNLFMLMRDRFDIKDTIQSVCPPSGAAMEVEAYATDPVHQM